MLKFQKYVSQSNVKDLGTLKAVATGCTMQFLTKNIKDTTKRVALLLRKGEESAILSCSKSVSDDIRAGKLSVGQLAGLRVLENDKGISFLSYDGQTNEAITLDDIQVEEIQRPSFSMAGLLKGAL